MKRIFTLMAIAALSLSVANANDRPVTFEQLPAAAQSFINSNFPAEKISYATVDDDFFRPDYSVMFANGTKVQFTHAGALEKIESNSGVPAALVPDQLKNYVNMHYPEMIITGYEIGRTLYELELSDRLELKFNKSFNLIEIDD